MKIVFTVDALINAGTEKSIYELCVVMKQNPEVEIYVVYFFPFHGLKSAFEELGINLYFLNVKGKYNYIDGFFKLKKILKNINPTVVVSSLYRANIISRLVCKSTNIPLVGTFVNNKYQKYLDTTKKKTLTERAFFLLDKYTSGIPKLYISNSDSIAVTNSKALAIPIDKIQTVYRGRSAEHINKWSAPDNKNNFKFISVGRLLYEKGYTELIEAFSKLKNNYPNIELTIFGEGNYRPQLTQLIADNNLKNEITLAGNVPFVYNRFSEANCFVFPSHNEGFSGALVEAMMSGIPSICSDIPMNLEAIKNDVTGKVFKVKNAESLYIQMKWMLENYNTAIELGNKASEDAFNRFEINAIAKQYLQLLKDNQ